jgi:autotransporter-associated beta strand protein
VTYAGTIANDGSGTGGLVKSGAGTLVLTGANTFAGPAYVTAGVLTVTGSSAVAASAVLPGSGSVRLSGGGFSVALDGDGTGRLETLAVAETVVLEQGGALTVGRAGSFAGVFNQAANKTVQLAGLTLGNNIATVTANNGFGLEITGATTLSGTLAGFNVAGTQAADTLPALRLSGAVQSAFGFNKSGTGTAVLAGDNRATLSGTLQVTAGVLGATSDAALQSMSVDAGNSIGAGGAAAGCPEVRRFCQHMDKLWGERGRARQTSG